MVKERGARAIKADVLARQHNLNNRQTSAVRYLLEKGSLTIRDYEGLCPKAERRTLQRDLKRLVEQGIVTEKGVSSTDPNRSYELSEKL